MPLAAMHELHLDHTDPFDDSGNIFGASHAPHIGQMLAGAATQRHMILLLSACQHCLALSHLLNDVVTIDPCMHIACRACCLIIAG